MPSFHSDDHRRAYLRLTINKKESKKALDILSNVNDAQKNLDKASKFNR